MKKNIFLFTSILLIIITVVWRFCAPQFLSSFYQIDEWGTYLFIVPIGYGIAQFFSKPNYSLKNSAAISIGAVISVLLSRSFEFVLPKLLMILAGAIITWITIRLTTEKD